MHRYRVRAVYRVNSRPPIYLVALVDVTVSGVATTFTVRDAGTAYAVECCAPGWRELAGLVSLADDPVAALVEAVEGL